VSRCSTPRTPLYVGAAGCVGARKKKPGGAGTGRGETGCDNFQAWCRQFDRPAGCLFSPAAKFRNAKCIKPKHRRFGPDSAAIARCFYPLKHRRKGRIHDRTVMTATALERPLRASAAGFRQSRKTLKAVAGLDFTLLPRKNIGRCAKAAAGITLARMVTMIRRPDRGIADAGRKPVVREHWAVVVPQIGADPVSDPYGSADPRQRSVRSRGTAQRQPPEMSRKEKDSHRPKRGNVGLSGPGVPTF